MYTEKEDVKRFYDYMKAIQPYPNRRKTSSFSYEG